MLVYPTVDSGLTITCPTESEARKPSYC